MVLSDEQARTYAGTSTVEAAATLLVTAGVPLSFTAVGGPGLKMEHAWVRAYVPTTYRGVGSPRFRPGLG